MTDKNHNSRVRIGALALSMVLTIAAAIGLTTASEYQGPRADAQARCGIATADEDSGSLLPTAPNDDPELTRLDRANGHHG
ncbi:MAG TPA: hypothetical protein VJU53_10845 [Burkholderiaceae bacterium]|nr:hypothetical protein [Burkholderiaceae bacterium]